MSKQHVFKCRLDTLTDGSEFTGSGTIFLTIVRVSHCSQEETIVARYALNGISPLISRLASDQALKLSHVRACFLSSMSVDCTAGLAALLLSLSNYSITGKLHVVASDGIDRYMDFLNELVLKRRNYPQVCSCVVPDDERVWWNVYQDEFIQVFAKRVHLGGDMDESESESSEEGDSDSDESDEEDNIVQENKGSADGEILIYVITINCTAKPISFAVLPSISNTTIPKNIFTGLPEEVNSHSDSKLDFVLHIDLQSDLHICQYLKSITKLHLVTRPTNARRDEGILIRSLHQSRLLHLQLPFAFPLCDTKGKENLIDAYEHDNNTSTHIHRLLSASTLNIDEMISSNIADSYESYVKDIKNKIEKVADITTDISIERAKEYNQLSSFYSGGQSEKKVASSTNHTDENEIDLSDSEEDEKLMSSQPTKKLKCNESKNIGDEKSSIFLDKSVPQLLVLGTGCASPSALRGSSGHALFLPTTINHTVDLSLAMVLECGEGFLTNLQRYCPTKQIVEKHLEQIRLIWISHAHLDHYGGLPSLLHEIIKLNAGKYMCTCFQRRGNASPIMSNRCQQSNTVENNRICQTCRGKMPPIIIAPSKVLEYLDLSLYCKNGILNGKKMYIGLNHRDFDSSPFTEQIREQVFNIELENPFPNGEQSYRPFRFLKNIMVDHCPNAFGCILGLNSASNMDDKVFTICYSGDTRPSPNLIQACNHFTHCCGDNISFLLHEATFDNDERGKVEAKKKRHSTIEEAKHVASQISVDSTLLTHFSQRYPKLPPGFDRDINHNVGFAFDGMLIPLRNENLQQTMAQVTCLTVAVLLSGREK